MKKILYFEGAGWVERGEVENCRIRTAFHNDKGEAIYLELSGIEVNKYNVKRFPNFKNVGLIDFCHYILGDDDENKHRINIKKGGFEYTKRNILSIVNSLGCSFDKVVILPNLAGYRVFKNSGGHNFGDVFEYDLELTAKREEIHEHFYNIEKSEGKKYPNFSLWVDQNDKHLLHLLRHFNGYNKHWSIRTDAEDWKNSVTETTLGKYAC